ncbi:NADP-dependent oxidoreductase [Amycolatopsis alkalitolerans]|uniref:NADP-dependent oxidoreductase n=1 Tax=Amycolatopsis alkalitolerans TaxID=2547244 RepID=A0A5C4M3V0_9PSEU|nr:NADP-dependent oxidoreductase [Amycolatopsis alkalitolerans]TNC27746.1 NADP-dependent oxidoreductase [Amycolatopsis alkalitolerans]
MKAVRYHQYGGPEVLRYEEAERPRPGAGQVLIRVAGTSFNPLDASIRAGFLQEAFPVAFPHTPGVDVAGTVEEPGEGVAAWSAGDAVIGFLPANEDGSAAEFVVAPADILAAAPSTIPLADAAAMPATALTAWQALFEHGGLEAGRRVLIRGAGGGVGGYAVQFAKRAGAFVIATASARSAATVRAQGADQIVDYTTGALAEAVAEPVDLVVNLVRDNETGLAALVADGGAVVTTTTPGEGDPARDVRAVSMYVRSDAAQLAEIARRVDSGELRVDVSERHPLSELALVHEQGAAGKFRGKVVLVP